MTSVDVRNSNVLPTAFCYKCALEENDNTAWHRLAAEQFFKDSSDSDAIYNDI